MTQSQGKTASKRPIIGSGEHTYEVLHDWGELPPHIKYGNTHGVCEDSQGHIYIHLVGLYRMKKDAVIIQGVDKAHPFARFL